MKLIYALLDIYNGKVTKIESVNNRMDGLLYITQYTRSSINNRLLIFGIKIDDNKYFKSYSVMVGNDTSKIEYDYDEGSGYYYNNNKESDNNIGISYAGFFYVYVYDDKLCDDINYIYKSEKILARPSIITDDMYKDMIKMLLNINKNLAAYTISSTFINGQYKENDFSKEVFDILSQLSKPLQQICLNPVTILKKKDTKIKYTKLKKINSKIVIEKSIYPFKYNFLASETFKSIDTYENRVIYSFLFKLRLVIKSYILRCQELIGENEREKNKITSLLNININKDYRFALNKKLKKVESILSVLSNQINNYKKCIEMLNEDLSYSLFAIYNNKLIEYKSCNPSQVFMHNIWYKKIYGIIKSLNKNISFIMDEKHFEELNIAPVHEIFEIWAFFRIIMIMITEQGWRLKNKNLVENTNNYLNKNGSLYNYSVDLNHKLNKKFNVSIQQPEVSVKLIYNKTLYLPNDKYLRPDYTFEFNCLGEKKTFYLDAKFHNYEEYNRLFYNDIEKVALEKYTDRLSNTVYRADGSYILHCTDTEQFRDFGGSTEKHHIIGSFALTPKNSSNIKTWIGMIMEWFYDEYNVCWNCGSTDIIEEIRETESHYSKIYYTCNQCGSFWVRTHCYKPGKNHKLIKHDLPEKQYHKGRENERWMVLCPYCGC